ncbi:hypothetical protein C1I98_24840 [Spongiactinospora gelatinilytica]|uniref:DUF4259 domain-containing protein n=1 Tax=Spongiactinospora gelatinilytica TaxID=2666298 RepID=A0A2W2GV42_9ACTN|nr:hypothetical protein C1I98_24840 [Spongiactinospora gelatinilytica]
MGTWDVGPFDNDTAADWRGDLNDAAPSERLDMIRRALAVEGQRHGLWRRCHPCWEGGWSG